MDTLLIFLFIFGIFGWCIWQLLRFTRDTIGESSPLKVLRIYHISAFWYFFGFDNLIMGILTIKAGALFKLLFTMEVYETGYRYWLAYLFLSVIVIILSTICILYVLLLPNHWKHTAQVTMTTLPEQHEIEINLQGKVIKLGKTDIVEVITTSNNAKLRFAFDTYYLENGDFFILSDHMPGSWVIEEYFKNIPAFYEETRFPYIS